MLASSCRTRSLATYPRIAPFRTTAPLYDAYKVEGVPCKPTLENAQRIEKGVVAAVDPFKRRIEAKNADTEQKALHRAAAAAAMASGAPFWADMALSWSKLLPREDGKKCSVTRISPSGMRRRWSPFSRARASEVPRYLSQLRRQTKNGRKYVVERQIERNGRLCREMVRDVKKSWDRARSLAKSMARAKSVTIDLSDVTRTP